MKTILIFLSIFVLLITGCDDNPVKTHEHHDNGIVTGFYENNKDPSTFIEADTIPITERIFLKVLCDRDLRDAWNISVKAYDPENILIYKDSVSVSSKKEAVYEVLTKEVRCMQTGEHHIIAEFNFIDISYILRKTIYITYPE